MKYEIQGVEEGYIKADAVKYSKPIHFESVVAAKLFIDLCEGIDWWRSLDQTEKDWFDPDETVVGSSYRYSYHPKIIKKGSAVKGCDVVIADIGE